jgi:hypothetical protein
MAAEVVNVPGTGFPETQSRSSGNIRERRSKPEEKA